MAAGQPGAARLPELLLVSPSFPPARGGIERTAGALANGLPSRRLRVVAGFPPLAGTVGMDRPDGPEIRWVRNEPPGGRRATLSVNAAAVRAGLATRPALVIATHIRLMPAARALSLATGSRSLLVVHAKEMPEQPELAEAAVAWADLVVAVSEYSRGLALAAGATAQRIRVINPGVTLPVDGPVPISDRPGPPTILTTSRMDDLHKGHHRALEAMVLLRQRIPEIRWVMVGEGRLREELERRATELGLAGSVLFTGAVDDEKLAEWLRTAHVFCLPSQPPAPGGAGEGFGMVLIEAGAHGLPCVAGRVPGVIDAVVENESGILVSPHDVAGLAGAIETLIRDTRTARRMGCAGQRRAAGLGWPQVIERYTEVIEELLEDSSSGVRPHFTPRHAGWMLDLLRGPRRFSAA